MTVILEWIEWKQVRKEQSARNEVLCVCSQAGMLVGDEFRVCGAFTQHYKALGKASAADTIKAELDK